MMMRAVIIDDEQAGIDILTLLLEKHVAGVKILATATKGRLGIDLIEEYQPDLIFLDISMPEIDGFELLQQLDWKNFHLIFTTAHQEHALRALKLSASDYLLKPLDYRELIVAVARIKEKINNSEKSKVQEYELLNRINLFHTNKIAIHSKNGIEYIHPNEVIYIESKSNYSLIRINEPEHILSPKTLLEFEKKICNNTNFMRVHHSFVINLHKVSRYIKDQNCIVMANEHKIPLSKSRKTVFMKWLDAD